MENEIICVFTLAVNEGKFPEFKHLVSEIVPKVDKEPGTYAYVYSVSDDQKVAHIIERYHTDAVVSHIDDTFSPFAERFLSLVSVTSLTVYGTPTSEAKKRLDSFGAVYMKPFDGFSK